MFDCIVIVSMRLDKTEVKLTRKIPTEFLS